MENQTQTFARPTREEAEKEVKQNYEAFSKMRFLPQDSGKFALLHDRTLVEILDTRPDALKMGLKLFNHIGCFSTQQIDPIPVDLGSLNYALRRPAH